MSLVIIFPNCLYTNKVLRFTLKKFSNLKKNSQNIRYSGVNCALGPSKSIRYNRDFVIAGFVSTCSTVILPGFQMLFVITGSSLQRDSL